MLVQKAILFVIHPNDLRLKSGPESPIRLQRRWEKGILAPAQGTFRETLSMETTIAASDGYFFKGPPMEFSTGDEKP